MELLTQAEYAKRRGVSAASVSAARKQRIKDAEVVRDGKVLINAELADELWQKNSLRTRVPRKYQQPEPAALPPTDQLPSRQDLKAFIMGLPEDQIPDDVNEIIRRKEHYSAEQKRVQALKERGEVVPVLEVKKAAQELGQALRDNVMGVPNRIAGMLAATTDAGEVTRLLEDELRIALRVMEVGANG